MTVESRATQLLTSTNEERIPFVPPKKGDAAGTLIVVNRKLVLLALRAPGGHEPWTWAGVGGGIEAGESAYRAALRETWEESNISLAPYRYSDTFLLPIRGGMNTFTTFIYHIPAIPAEWDIRINEESLAWGWFKRRALLSLPLHTGLSKTFKHIGWDITGSRHLNT
jgi:8-oxo-dGTP pyrophosphatase MutT (NUDIX family)